MRITENRLRSIIRSVILENEKKNPYMPEKSFGAMSFKYNDIDIEIVDSGDIYMYGDIELFDDKIKKLFDKFNVKKLKSIINSIKEDRKLNKEEKEEKILGFFEPFEKSLSNKEFMEMEKNIRICKFVKTGEGEWNFYDMPLNTLLQPRKNVTQYAYLGKNFEEDLEPDENIEELAGLRAKGLFKLELKPQNFVEMPLDLIMLAKKIGKLKKIYEDFNFSILKGYRDNIQMGKFLASQDEMKKFVGNQKSFDADNTTKSKFS